MFMQLQEVVFIQLQGNYTIVNFQGNIFTQRKLLMSRVPNDYHRAKKYYKLNAILSRQYHIILQR